MRDLEVEARLEHWARRFHEIYEEEAVVHGWTSSTPAAWEDLPVANRLTTRSTVRRVLQELADVRYQQPAGKLCHCHSDPVGHPPFETCD